MPKSLLLEDEDHEIFKKSAKEYGLTLKEYVTLCCSYYSRRGLNPKRQVSLEELSTVLVSLIQKQEKKFHDKTLKQVNHITKEIGKMEFVLNNILFDIKMIKTKKE